MLGSLGIRVEKPNKGSHWKAIRNSDGKTYPLPCHNGEKSELDDKYLRGLCNCFGFDLTAFKKLL
ncbi:MAG: hypothetical protein JST54_12465 [Deltaproteobacteria bacterium]|nr:hypothetical protein [Deltaproteobacteria bacterium]